jgi:EAL domain-containing protein (putative c-di-GMP-specific phosphodiesterase class I)
LIAEGVERREEADALGGIGVQFAQGFLFGRPERAKR